MYTRCPDCNEVFRVTAEILQQAAGRVRCGACGHVFNALDGLSEGPPSAGKPPPGGDETVLPTSVGGLPAEDEVRIEDTGVEWRVVEPDRGAAEDAGEDDEADASALRWYIHDETAEPGNDARIPESAAARRQPSLELGSSRADEERYDDNTPLPGLPDDDDDDDKDEPYALAEPPRRRAADLVLPRAPELDERQVDFVLGEPEEWTDLLEEIGAGDEAAPAAAAEVSGNAAVSAQDAPPDQEPMDEEPTAEHPTIDPALLAPVAMADNEGERLALVADDERDDGDELAPVEDDTPGDAGDGPELVLDKTSGDAGDGLELVLDKTSGDAGEGPDLVLDDAAGDAGEGLELVPDDAPGDDAAPVAPDPDATGELEAPAMLAPAAGGDDKARERLIDEELLRASGRLQDPSASGSYAAGGTPPPHVETIIMEGELVRSSLHGELVVPVPVEETPPAAPAESAADEAPGLRDTYLRLRDALPARKEGAPRRRPAALAAALLLGLLLAVQLVHAHRKELAIWPFFADTVGVVYSRLGAPITPDWDVNAWQFEKTSGGTDASDRILTISASIANRSEHAMPYPLLQVALTDRYEEIVSAELLEPEQYLDIRSAQGMVDAGDSITARVTIAPAGPDVSGYKLNVCYPLAGTAVRCATGAFRND